MESQTRSVILLQYLHNNEAFNFASPVMDMLEREKKPEDVLYSVDNFSDSLTLHYAKKLMDHSSTILLICDLQEATKAGALLSLLNHAVKKKNVRLISIGRNPLLKPFMVACQGEIVENIEELKGLL